MAVQASMALRSATCLVLLWMVSASGCSYPELKAGPDRAALEVRNESRALIGAVFCWNQLCEHGPRCLWNLPGPLWQAPALIPAGDSTTFVSGKFDIDAIAVVVENENPTVIWRDGVRPVGVNETCIVTLTADFEIEVAYAPPRSDDPLEEGVTRKEPGRLPLASSDAVIVRVLARNGAVISDAKLAYTVTSTAKPASASGYFRPELHRDSLWIPRNTMKDMESHLGTGPFVWEMTVEAEGVNRRIFPVSPESSQEIVCQF